MTSLRSSESERVAKYFDTHAVDFDSIYGEDKSRYRRIRDRLSRGVVVERLALVQQLAAENQPRSVLDVGCGAGRFSVPLALAGSEATGLDFADEMIALAERYAADADVADRCRFLAADVMTWDAQRTFDMSLAIGVFDYVSDPEPLFARIVELTRGRVVFSFPRRWHALVPVRWVRLRLAGCPVHFYTRSDVVRLAGNRLETCEVKRFGRDLMLVGETLAS